LAGTEADLNKGEVGKALKDTATGALFGKALSVVPKMAGKLGSGAEKLGKHLYQVVADRAAAPAEGIAASAKGTAGAVTSAGSRLLTGLERKIGLSPESIAANVEAGGSPKAGALAEKLASKYRTDLPGAMEHIESANALMEQTAKEAAAARTPEAVEAFRKAALKEQNIGLLRNYAAPALGSAIGGAVGIPGGLATTMLGMALGGGAGGMAKAILTPERLAGALPYAARGLAATGRGVRKAAGTAASALEPIWLKGRTAAENFRGAKAADVGETQ
jgi:hypothetical protein